MVVRAAKTSREVFGHSRLLLVVAASLGVLSAAPAEATGFKTIHAFTGGADSAVPGSGLVIGPGGALYGATQSAIYSLSEDAKGNWSFATILNLSPGVTSLVGTSTALYGVQGLGAGATVCKVYGQPCGAVVEMTPPAKGQTTWKTTTIYDFKSGKDGAIPNGITLGADGALYGTTQEGGGSHNCSVTNNVPNGCGTVFKLAKAAGKWTETLLHAYVGGSDGRTPMAPPSLDAAGDVFVTTFLGGATASQTAAPGSAGYSCEGNGSVAEFKSRAEYDLWLSACKSGGPEYAYSVMMVVTLSNASDAPPIQSASISNADTATTTGTAANGGIFTNEGGGRTTLCPDLGNNGCGVIALLTEPKSGKTPWTLTSIHAFGQTDGAQPYGAFLVWDASTLYGVTYYGGASSIACKSISGLGYGCGVIYKLEKTTSSWRWGGVVHAFDDGVNGALPVGELVLYKGLIVGATRNGGQTSGACSPAGCGVIFALKP